MLRVFTSILLAVAVSNSAQAQCPGGVCPVRTRVVVSVSPAPAIRLPGRPVERAAQATAVVVRGTAKVAALPAKATKKFLQRQPVRRVLRAAAKVATGNGPILSKIRSRRGCR